MKKIIFTGFFVFAFLFNAVVSAQTLDEVLKKYYETINQEKLSTVQTVTMKGKISQGGMEISFLMYQKRPLKARTEAIVQDTKVISAYDGENGWSINPFMGANEPQKMQGSQLEQLKDQADIDGSLFNSEKKGYKLELLPQEEVEGIKDYVIKVIKPDSSFTLNYIQADNYLSHMVKTKVNVQGMDTEIESYPGNYKKVDDILMPFSVSNKMGGQEFMKIVIESIEFNNDVADSLFTMPEKK